MGVPYTGFFWRFVDLIRRGVGAFVVMGYPEANAKNGTQWEAQRRLTGMALNQRATSIIKTGSLPVDLKARLFAYTGTGVIARIYKDPTYTGGTPDPVYNMNSIPGQAATLQTQLLTEFTLTADGTPVAAPMYLIGPSQIQGKGSLLTSYGGNRILAPNTSYLLTFESLEAAQDVTARLEFYEGELDLPTV